MNKRPRVAAILLARQGSSRLKNKMVLPFAGKTVIESCIDRLTQCSTIDDYVLATTTAATDDAFEKIALTTNIRLVRGSENDVVSRMMDAVKSLRKRPDIIIRACCDNPLVMPTEIDAAVCLLIETGADIVTPFELNTLPFGYSMVVMTRDCLEKIDRQAVEETYREHVENYCFEHPDEFRIMYQEARDTLYCPDLSLTLDYKEDYHRLVQLAKYIETTPIRDQPSHLINCIKSRRVGLILNNQKTGRSANAIVNHLTQRDALISYPESVERTADAVDKLITVGVDLILSANPFQPDASPNDPIPVVCVDVTDIHGVKNFILRYNASDHDGRAIYTEQINSGTNHDEFLISCLPRLLIPLQAGSVRTQELFDGQLPPINKQGKGKRFGFSSPDSVLFPTEVIIAPEITQEISLISELARSRVKRITIAKMGDRHDDASLQSLCERLADRIPNVPIELSEYRQSAAGQEPEISAFEVIAIDARGKARFAANGKLGASVGDIRQISLAQIWQDKPMRKMRVRAISGRYAA